MQKIHRHAINLTDSMTVQKLGTLYPFELFTTYFSTRGYATLFGNERHEFGSHGRGIRLDVLYTGLSPPTTMALFGVLPMVPLVILPMVPKLPMVPLVANGTIGLPMVPIVPLGEPMVPLALPLVQMVLPMVPLVKP